VKGKLTGVDIYELLSKIEGNPEEDDMFLDRYTKYEEALNLYFL
jgi:hypothetical protein